MKVRTLLQHVCLGAPPAHADDDGMPAARVQPAPASAGRQAAAGRPGAVQRRLQALFARPRDDEAGARARAEAAGRPAPARRLRKVQQYAPAQILDGARREIVRYLQLHREAGGGDPRSPHEFEAILRPCEGIARRHLQLAREQQQQRMRQLPPLVRERRLREFDKENDALMHACARMVRATLDAHLPGGLIAWESGCRLPEAAGSAPRRIFRRMGEIGRGGQAQVTAYVAEDGRPIAAKLGGVGVRQGADGGPTDDLTNEFMCFRRVLQVAGPHPNLVRVYGIAHVPQDQGIRPALLMDAIPGNDGVSVLASLQRCLDSGKITAAEHASAVQFLGRRLLGVARHLHRAGVVHCDIKPENMVVDRNTGEPVVIDLGLASAPGGRSLGHDPAFAAPEQLARGRVDERTDVFQIGATMVEAMEGPVRTRLAPPHRVIDQRLGVAREPHWRLGVRGLYVEHPGHAIESAYTRAADAMLAADVQDRPAPGDAMEQLAFFKDSIFDDERARAVIMKAMADTGADAGIGPQRYQATQARIAALTRPGRATLAAYADLCRDAKTDRHLAQFLDTGELLRNIRPHLEREAAQRIQALLQSLPGEVRDFLLRRRPDDPAAAREADAPLPLPSGTDEDRRPEGDDAAVAGARARPVLAPEAIRGRIEQTYARRRETLAQIREWGEPPEEAPDARAAAAHAFMIDAAILLGELAPLGTLADPALDARREYLRDLAASAASYLRSAQRETPPLPVLQRAAALEPRLPDPDTRFNQGLGMMERQAARGQPETPIAAAAGILAQVRHLRENAQESETERLRRQRRDDDDGLS